VRISAPQIAVILVAVSTSCGTSTQPYDPGDASYSVVYTPARIVYATVNCDRYLSYGILSLGRRRSSFELSVNLTEDCTRAGGRWSYWEVLMFGHYAIADTVLTFTPDSARTPAFSGTFDAAYVRLTLPPRSDSLAPVPIPMQLGPRMPF
jgi:hypothetical protein